MARGGNRDRYNYARARCVYNGYKYIPEISRDFVILMVNMHCREPLLLVSKLFRGYSLKRLPTPYEYAVSAEGAAPLYSSVSAAISPLVRHSIQLLIYANDFRLVSSKQRFIMLWITVAPLFRRFELTCSAFACHNPATLAMFSHVATILKGHLHVFLPVVVWSKLEQVNPCLSVCLWSLLIIGYFLPLSIGNVWEERSRLEFLLANRIGALSPPVLPVALVNAIVVTTLAGSIVALALDTVTTFVGIL